MVGDGQVDPALSALRDVLLAQVDDLAAEMAVEIRLAVPYYRDDSAVSQDILHDSLTVQLRFALAPLGAKVRSFDITEARETGRQRASAGVPLLALVDTYRIGSRFLWTAIVREAERTGFASSSALVQVASDIWLMQDQFTTAMVAGYREVQTKQIVAHEQERSALVDALIQGRINDPTTVWEAADILRLSPRGVYVVVSAELTAVGRQVLQGIEDRLAGLDINSAWRLLPDLEVGIVNVAVPAHLEQLVTVLRDGPLTRIGVSPTYDDLMGTAYALRCARIAMTGSRLDEAPVTVFDESVMAVAAVGAPDIMKRVATNVLGGLDAAPAYERQLLLDTLAAWLDHGGSASRTGEVMFCHRNTVRARLRRIEELTGRSLTDPRGVAELCLAFESDRRLPG
jgi:PucR C-terminal helix-turn-helix domain/GGDEF-like domain